jgi:hypothetical protein
VAAEDEAGAVSAVAPLPVAAICCTSILPPVVCDQQLSERMRGAMVVGSLVIAGVKRMGVSIGLDGAHIPGRVCGTEGGVNQQGCSRAAFKCAATSICFKTGRLAFIGAPGHRLGGGDALERTRRRAEERGGVRTEAALEAALANRMACVASSEGRGACG